MVRGEGAKARPKGNKLLSNSPICRAVKVNECPTLCLHYRPSTALKSLMFVFVFTFYLYIPQAGKRRNYGPLASSNQRSWAPSGHRMVHNICDTS